MDDITLDIAETNNIGIDILIDEFSLSIYKKKLIIDSSLSICHNRNYGLVGINGSGKTTLMNHIASRKLNIPVDIDLLHVQQEIEPSEILVIDSILEANIERSTLLSRFNELQLEIETNEELINEFTQISSQLNAIEYEKDISIVEKILNGLGFTTEMQQLSTSSFSGGWRMRIALAQALYMKPTLLLLDEPTNHLDLNATIWLEDYLANWENTLVVISHNQEFLNNICTDIISIEKNKLYNYKGNYATFRNTQQQNRRNEEKEWEKLNRAVKQMQKKSIPKKQVQEFIKKKKYSTT